MWAALAVSAVLAAVPSDAGPLQIKNDRFTYGVFGQVRTDDKVTPGDILVVAFDIDGLQVKEDGKVRYSMAMQLLNKDGKSVYTEKPIPRESINALGGASLPSWSLVNIGTETTPGQYTVKVSVADLSVKDGKPVTLERKFEVTAPRFGIVQSGFGYDKPPQSPPPAPPVAAAGQQFLVFFTVVGFDAKPGKTKGVLACNVHVELSVLDDGGKPTLAKPFLGDVKEIAEEFKAYVPFQFQLPLNRAGKFKVKFTAKDGLSNKTATQELDLNVLEVK